MLTDWLLIARLARELQERLHGARVEDSGLLNDGRTAIVFRRGGRRTLLAVDLFSSPPLVTLEAGELGILEEPGFVRAVARALKGMSLANVSSRRNDRLLRLSFAARSRFGVGDALELYVELVPRFGNIVLVKNGIIVAARKEFAPSQNARRTVLAGAAYALPPLPPRTNALAPGAAVEEPPNEALHVYRRDDGSLAQAYVISLAGLEGVSHSREGSLIELFAELRTAQLSQAGRESGRRRRDALLRRLSEREGKLRGELAGLAAKRERAKERDALREQGEAIFANLHALDPASAQDEKERAAELFARYKKLGKSLPHIAQREALARGSLEILETLRWEAERAGDEDLEDVEAAVAEIEPRRRLSEAPKARKRKRRTLEVRTPLGSRILVGRSPLDNAELTFRVARPNDLWFHARGIPGAHVILARDDRSDVPPEDLAIAASLAAYYSKAQQAASAAVDYTLRKHVRKQRDAPPGLVWYTQAQTMVVAPQSTEAVARL